MAGPSSRSRLSANSHALSWVSICSNFKRIDDSSSCRSRLTTNLLALLWRFYSALTIQFWESTRVQTVALVCPPTLMRSRWVSICSNFKRIDDSSSCRSRLTTNLLALLWRFYSALTIQFWESTRVQTVALVWPPTLMRSRWVSICSNFQRIDDSSSCRSRLTANLLALLWRFYSALIIQFWESTRVQTVALVWSLTFM